MSYPIRRITPNPWLMEPRPKRNVEIVGVMIHATRSGVSDGDDGPRTERWMQNPNNVVVYDDGSRGGSSCDAIVFETGERVLVSDYLREAPTYCAGFGDSGTWSAGWYYYQVEMAQGRPEDPYTAAEIDSAAELTADLAIRHNFTPHRIPFLTQTGAPPRGICSHEASANGRKLGKSDPGAIFPWVAFLDAVASKIAAAGQGDGMSSAEYNALNARVSELEQDQAAAVEYLIFEGRPEVYAVEGDTLAWIFNKGALDAQADEQDPQTVKLIRKGTPEWGIYKQFAARYRTIPARMMGE